MDIRQPKVLIADDENHIRILIEKIMKLINFEVVAKCFNGDDAIENFKRLKPDIVLLDINMPVKTGIDALKEIMAIDDNAFVIMLTSVANLETVKECVDLGAVTYIRKDTPITEIGDIVKKTWQEWNED